MIDRESTPLPLRRKCRLYQNPIFDECMPVSCRSGGGRDLGVGAGRRSSPILVALFLTPIFAARPGDSSQVTIEPAGKP